MESTLEYSTLQKAILLRVREGLLSGDSPENLINLVDTALDYGFYLIDDPAGINGAPYPLEVEKESK